MRYLLFALATLFAACGDNRTFPDRDAYTPGEVEPLTCVPNLDGRIDASELAAALNVPVRYLASPAGVARPVSIEGSVNEAGQLTWDFGADYADDQVATLEATTPGSFWFAAHFPDGEFTSPLDLGATIMGVYRHTGEYLQLLGYASREENPSYGQTRVVYAAPIAVYKFPLAVGAEWVSVGEVTNAVVRGLPYAGRDTYVTKVDGAGRLTLPDLTFTQALRVRTTTTIEPAIGTSIVRRQVGWVFECFGEVARAVASDGEPEDNFTTTAELRRLGF